MAGLREHDPYEALRIPAYRRLLTGGILASVGLEIQATAVGYELYERTRDPWILGLAGLAQFLPVLLLALPAGQAADRFNRKILFQLAQGIAASAALCLALLSYSRGPVGMMLLCLFVSGVGRALGAPSRASLLPQLVPTGTLPNAVAWNSTGWQIANISGPALAGFVLAAVDGSFPGYGTVAAYALTVACSAGCIILLVAVRPQLSGRPTTNRSLASLLAGLHFVWNTQLLLAAITLDLFAVLLGGATALLPAFARDILGVGEIGFGWLRAAPALGAMLMAVTLAHRPPLHRPGRALLLAVAGFGAATIVFGLSEWFALSFAMLLLTGAFDNVSVVVRSTLMQLLTPDEMRGRVAAVNTVFISSSNELGAFESGLTAKLFGYLLTVVAALKASVLFGGVGTLVVVFLVRLRWPRLWQLGPLHELSASAAASSTPPPSAAPAEDGRDLATK